MQLPVDFKSHGGTSIKPARWLRVLAWMETAGGAAGLYGYLVAATNTPPGVLSTWHHLLAVAFFGANLIAGILLLQQREQGLALSFFIQLLQIVFWNSGIAWIVRAGFHITPLIASTGMGLYWGVSTEYFTHSVTTTAFSVGAGMHAGLHFGFFDQPLDQATFACGVNLIALYFALHLRWERANRRAAPALLPELPPSPSRPSPWPLPLAYAAISLALVFVLFGGPKVYHRTKRQWIATTGDTLDVLRYDVNTSIMLDPKDKSVSKEQYLWVQFRSDFGDTSRDRANALALAVATCRAADSAGVPRILVQPTRTQLLGLVRSSRNYTFRVDTVAHCSESAE